MQRRAAVGSILGLALALAAGVPRVAAGGIVPETLQDGRKIEIDGDKVYVLGDGSVRKGDGSVKPADKKPQRVTLGDGSYKLKSGKTLEVKDGKLVAKP